MRVTKCVSVEECTCVCLYVMHYYQINLVSVSSTNLMQGLFRLLSVGTPQRIRNPLPDCRKKSIFELETVSKYLSSNSCILGTFLVNLIDIINTDTISGFKNQYYFFFHFGCHGNHIRICSMDNFC